MFGYKFFKLRFIEWKNASLWPAVAPRAKNLHCGARPVVDCTAAWAPDRGPSKADCPAPYIRPFIFVFSNKVSGTGGFMFRAWWGLIWLYCLSQALITTWACLVVWNHSALRTSFRKVPLKRSLYPFSQASQLLTVKREGTRFWRKGWLPNKKKANLNLTIYWKHKVGAKSSDRSLKCQSVT